MADNYKFSQDYELIPPQKQRSYPISTTEWNLIKKRINNIKDDANLWQTVGSILVGTAVPTLITALIGDFKNDKSTWICWTAFWVTAIPGGLAFYFGSQQRKTQNETKEDVLDYMNIIEERFASSLQGLVILSAKYGIEDKFADVTILLNSLITEDKLTILANNQNLGSDPYPGKVKQLIVDYALNGKRETSTITEGATLFIG